MDDLRAGSRQQTADVACQWQQRARRHARRRRLARWWLLKVRGGAPDQATPTVRQGNRDEPRATGTGKRQNRQTLAR
jgi:hypothetical protein